MPQPVSIRRHEAHRARRPNGTECHTYPEDQSQGCYCNLLLDHPNQTHACACGLRWIGEH
jgi:hypothetical protein